MPSSDDNRFRDPRAESSGGLKKIQPTLPPLPSVAGLKLDTSFDVSTLKGFESAPVEGKRIADRVKPTAGGAGLKVDADLSKLDEGVRRIHAQQKTEKLQHLIEEAQVLIGKKQYRAAMKPLDEAWHADSSSAQIAFLRGYCLFHLGDYDNAIEALQQARQKSRDPQTLILVLALEAACHKAVVEALESQLFELLQQKKTQQALTLVDKALQSQPSNIAFLYHRCNLLWYMGRTQDARRAVAEAMQRSGPENAELFQELLKEFAAAEHQGKLESARLALRRSDPGGAIEILKGCAALAGNEQFECVRAYAQEMMPKGFLGALFSRGRVLDSAGRQKVLQWLLSEEMNSGAAALGEKRFDAAVQAFSSASMIDSRCGVICFLYGVALFQRYQDALERHQLPDPDAAITSLRKASEQLVLCAVDPAVAHQGTNLRKLVDNHCLQLQEVRGVNNLVSEFNDLMVGLERRPVQSGEDLEAAERRFRDLGQSIQAVLESRPSKGAEQTLSQLAAAVHRNLEQIEEVRDKVAIDPMVGNCIKNFNDMMSHYQKSPIASHSELMNAKSRLASIQEMAKKARKKVPRGSEGWRLLDQLEQAMQGVQRQLNQ